MVIAARAAASAKLPNFILYPFFILSILRRFISLFLSTLGLSVFMESAHDATDQQLNVAKQIESANRIRKILPIMKYNVYISTNNVNDKCTADDGCTVCLCEFESEDEIRQLMGCRHIFHRSCLDGWIDHDHSTCPLCRIPFIHMPSL